MLPLLSLHHHQRRNTFTYFHPPSWRRKKSCLIWNLLAFLESRLLDICNLSQFSCLWQGLVPCGSCGKRSWFHLTGTKAGIYEHIVPKSIWAPPAIPDDHTGFSCPAELGSGSAWVTNEQELCPVGSVAQLLFLWCSPEAAGGRRLLLWVAGQPLDFRISFSVSWL